MKKLWAVLVRVGKAIWSARKPILWIGGALAVILFGRRVAALILSAVIGKVHRQDQFRKIDDDHIEIKTSSGWYPVDLTTIRAGKKVKADNVTAAEYVPGKAAVVEVDNNVLTNSALNPRVKDGLDAYIDFNKQEGEKI